jgi:hypothetical protein
VSTRDAGHDDGDALSWGGDDDPTLDVRADAVPARARQHPRPSATAAPDAPLPDRPLPRGFTPVGKGSDTVGTAHADAAPLGNVGLVAIGMIAMASILFAVGWLIAGIRLLAEEGLPVPAGTLGALMTVAALGPLVWFGAVFALTRHTRAWIRFAWLIAGLILFVPWPFIVTGALA